MISIKIILLLIIIQILVMQFWLKSEFDYIKHSFDTLDNANNTSVNNATVQSLRHACFLKSRLENERN